MKNYEKCAMTLIFAFLATLGARAQGIQTITVNGVASTTNSVASSVITVPTNSYAVLKSVYPNSLVSLVANIHGQTFTFALGDSIAGLAGATVNPVVFSGPATIQLQTSTNANFNGDAAFGFATFDIEPGPFPPGKAVTIGAYSGNVQVTMQMSTDLVNWTTAVNGMVYTNSPDARFFRVQLVTKAQGP